MKKGINYKKETKCSKFTIEVKEDSEEFYTRGYIATTHIDDVGDKLQEETLNAWATQINSNSSSSPVSIHHDREDTTLIGLPVSKSATVKQLDDGEKGLWVETHYNKTHPEFQNVKYEIDNGFLSNYSIEYNTHDDSTTFMANVDGQTVRILTPETDLVGYGVASPRTAVNKDAELLKEKILYKEVVHMVKETEDEKLKKKKEEDKMKKDKKEEVEEKPEAPEEPKAEEKPEAPEEAKPEESEEVAEEEEGKEKIKAEVKKITTKEMITAQVKAEVKEMMENKPRINEPEKKEKVEFKEAVQYKEAVFGEKKAPLSEQWKAAATLHNQLCIKEGNLDLPGSGTSLPFETKEVEDGRFGMLNKNVIEVKAADGGLIIPDNYSGASTTWANIFANYEEYPAELGAVYQPVIINQLNDAVTTFNLLPKVDYSNSSTITFRVRWSRNTDVGGYTETQANTTMTNTDFDGNVGRLKSHQIFSYYKADVSVSGPMIHFANAAGGIGDVYSDEIKWSTFDLMKNINSAILGTGAGTAENACLGFEVLMLTTGNLYGHARATYTTLQSGGYDNMSSAAITLKKMREMIRTVVQNGARKEDLVFICDHLQEDFIKALIQDMQRIVPTSGRVGFTGTIELDGVPIFADTDCNTDDLFLVDLAHTKIGISVPPTYEELGKQGDARRGYIKTYFNLFCTAPNHNYWIYGLAAS